MRFRGKEYTGLGVPVAVIDSGINRHDARVGGQTIEGWSITLNATNHALLKSGHADENGHGTEIAAAVRTTAPNGDLVVVKIMDARLRTSADLMAAGIETAFRHGAKVINLSMGTPNMGKALLLRDACALAVENGSIVLAAAHPKGERAYPADLPETLGVASHPDCPLNKFYYFTPHRFPRKEWGNLSGKFLAYGHGVPRTNEGPAGPYRGSGLAPADLSGRLACLWQALPDESPHRIIEQATQHALTPVPEIGYR